MLILLPIHELHPFTTLNCCQDRLEDRGPYLQVPYFFLHPALGCSCTLRMQVLLHNQFSLFPLVVSGPTIRSLCNLSGKKKKKPSTFHSFLRLKSKPRTVSKRRNFHGDVSEKLSSSVSIFKDCPVPGQNRSVKLKGLARAHENTEVKCR